MNRRLRAILTVLMAVVFLTSVTPIFAASSNKKEDGVKTSASKSQKSIKKNDSKKSSKSTKAPFKGKININKASKAELMKLPGIGEVKASEIIKARKKGKFKSSADLMKVNGVGEKTLKGMAKHLTF